MFVLLYLVAEVFRPSLPSTAEPGKTVRRAIAAKRSTQVGRATSEGPGDVDGMTGERMTMVNPKAKQVMFTPLPLQP